MRLATGANKRTKHPVDLVEQIANGHGWSFERLGDDEIAVLVSGKWAEYDISFSWMEDREALHLACGFDVRLPEHRKMELRALLSEINGKMLIGHFDFWENSQLVIYRQALVLAGGVPPSDAQLEALLTNALDACENHGPAFQMVAWSNVKAGHALRCALFETIGNA